MKKLLLVALLLLSILSYSQETFVNKYTVFMTKIDGVESEVKPAEIVFVFNEGKTTDIVIHGTKDTIRLYRTKEIVDGKSNEGNEYQLLECIESETGDRYVVQLFKDTVRLFINDSPDYIEHY